jgi:hypothetical protein
MSRTLTLYRDDSTVQIVYQRVKHFFWTAGNTVLVVAQYIDDQDVPWDRAQPLIALRTPPSKDHRYIHWPRERFCWFKDEGK